MPPPRKCQKTRTPEKCPKSKLPRTMSPAAPSRSSSLVTPSHSRASAPAPSSTPSPRGPAVSAAGSLRPVPVPSPLVSRYFCHLVSFSKFPYTFGRFAPYFPLPCCLAGFPRAPPFLTVPRLHFSTPSPHFLSLIFLPLPHDNTPLSPHSSLMASPLPQKPVLRSLKAPYLLLQVICLRRFF